MTEAQLQKAVIALARLLGWRVAHFRPALTRSGRWVTPVQGDGRGFPDLALARPAGATLLRPGRLIFRELKVGKGRTTMQQALWLGALRGAGADAGVWTEKQWLDGTIEKELRT